MLLSYCITCHKRTEDLLQTMPFVIIAANASPPVEIVVIDYGNNEPLKPLLADFKKRLKKGNKLVVKKYRKRNYYHMGHARNLSIKKSKGDAVIIGATDIILSQNFFAIIRILFEETGAMYLRSRNTDCIGILACSRKAIFDIGGYDERFEFYGPEDKDIIRRLERYGAKIGYLNFGSLLTLIRTPNHQKTANYRLKLSKYEMAIQGHEIMHENDVIGRIVVNEGINWGEG